jgi:hypothetical protein
MKTEEAFNKCDWKVVARGIPSVKYIERYRMDNRSACGNRVTMVDGTPELNQDITASFL